MDLLRLGHEFSGPVHSSHFLSQKKKKAVGSLSININYGIRKDTIKKILIVIFNYSYMTIICLLYIYLYINMLLYKYLIWLYKIKK